MRTVRRGSSAARRYCDADVCLVLTKCGSQMRSYSRSNHPTPRMIVYAAASKKSSVASRLIKARKHFSESMMASVAVSKAGKTSVHFIDNMTKEPRQMQVTTAKLCCSDVFSRRFVRSIRRSFRVSTGRHAVSSSEDCEVNCQVPAVYRAEFRRTVCMATQQPGLKSV